MSKEGTGELTRKGSIEEILAREGRLIYSNAGDSMYPLIRQGQDLLVIERPKGWDEIDAAGAKTVKKLKRFDIPLYRRDNSGVYVLHRAVAIRRNDYVLCGDNRWHREYGITDKNIVGRLTAIVRNGKELPLSGWRYGLYVLLWCRLFFLRALLLKGSAMVRREKWKRDRKKP